MRPIASFFVSLTMFAALGVSASVATAEKSLDPQTIYKTNWSSSQQSALPNPRFKKKEVNYKTFESPGTIVIETYKKYLYLMLGNGKALRYGIGVGREGFSWQGEERVTRKAEWPDWHPPREMREREPDLPEMIEGGPESPLGARALYLGNTEYRIHGTLFPATIGHSVSSGCIRLTNDAVIALYARVKIGTKLIVN